MKIYYSVQSIFTEYSCSYFTQSQGLFFKLHKNKNWQFNLCNLKSIVKTIVLTKACNETIFLNEENGCLQKTKLKLKCALLQTKNK